MPFKPPSWAPPLDPPPPSDISIPDFIFSSFSARDPASARPPFTCGLSGLSYTGAQLRARTSHLAAALSRTLGWGPHDGRPALGKVVALFAANGLDNLAVAWAAQLLGGACTPANAAYGAAELAHQLRDSGAGCVFVGAELLGTALEALGAVEGLARERVFVIEAPREATGGKEVRAPRGFRTLEELVEEGRRAGEMVEPLRWEKGEGARQTAFLCYSSGTSGLPKGVMISHRNVIANILQVSAFERQERERQAAAQGKKDGAGYSETVLGLLPMSHIYALVLITHSHVYRGDSVIVLPRFEFASFLRAIEEYRIERLYLVPPIVILMAKNKAALAKHDLSCVKGIFTGAAPLGEETAEELVKLYPKWQLLQGYGLTETSTVVTMTAPDDIWFGSSGSILPGIECRIVDPEGNEITEYGKEGELIVKSPAVTLGYLNNEKATRETFSDGWMRTGDVAVVKKSKKGHEHVFIVDRIKELIKVKGHQVAPAELEAHLLTHPAVADCAVIQVPDDRAGEVPKAYVVKAADVGIEESDRALARDIARHVEKHKTKYKWLAGGVVFIDVIPKSPSGKILRRLLRDKDKEARRKKGAKM